MAGYLPQNRGNKSANRFGPIISRKLRAAGFNISPAERKYKYNGMFVSAQGDCVTVMLDLGNTDRNLSGGHEVAEVLKCWTDLVTYVKVHQSEATGTVFVRCRFIR